jgi:hypothetical protein
MGRGIGKKMLAALVVGLALYGAYEENPHLFQSLEAKPGATNNQQLTTAYKNQRSDVQVSGSGTVVRNLPDDTKGSRHQKFLLKISPGHTLLVAHNINLAPRINTLREGDTVEFYGEYEWNAKGGVLHWTHHDPGGRHADGWLKHKEVVYQ